MKRLLWSVSLACFLPVIAEMPSRAAGKLDVVTKPSTQFSVNPFANTESLTPALPVVESSSFGQPAITNSENPFAPVQLAGNPAKKKPAALKAASRSTLLQPAQADNNNNLLSQNAPTITPAEVTPPSTTPPSTPAPEATPPSTTPPSTAPSGATDLDRQLGDLNNQKFPVAGSGGFSVSPALSINNPVGFGADNGVGFLSGSYQSKTRGTDKSDGELGIGVGLFDATEAVGLELSYTINSFGNSQGFGSGGFNAKLHKRFGDSAVAIGWNRFANITFGNTGVQSDYPKNSYYAVATQVIRTTEDIDSFFSRVALSAGVGGGQFLPASTTSTNLNAGGVNVFGSAAFRVAKPVSAIVEWTGQDLAAGLSITPFGDSFPLVITPAFRDISGVSGQSARFVLGVGTAFKF